MIRLLPSLLIMIALAGPAYAISSPAEMLPNPVQEKRAETIGEQLRCLVCQNESVEQSDADLAKDLRHIIRERVADGQSNKQIIAWMVDRYGDFIRLDPPFDPETYALWFAPMIAVGAGAAAAMLARRRAARPPAPLSPAEQQRLKDLLQ
ncbi:MAG: cytochrome c-type biogenesis protein CcmH [Acetobacteraceae bacterium]|nr:cytochrome c-type biogenesis protein CcmH [Acetobacteraceae bacterium]